MKLKVFVLLSCAVIFLMNYLILGDQKICIISIPKCGTHLLCQCIKLMTGKNYRFGDYKFSDKIFKKIKRYSKFFYMHTPYCEKDNHLLNSNNIYLSCDLKKSLY